MSTQQAILTCGALTAPIPLGSFTFAGSASATSIAWPSGHQTDDLAILLVSSDASAIPTPSGWNLIGFDSTGAAGGVNSGGMAAFWRRATSGAEANVTIADTGNSNIAVMFAFRGADLSVSPIEGFSSTANGAAIPDIPSVTTLGASRYVVGAWCNVKEPSSTGTGLAGDAAANANLINQVELADYGVAQSASDGNAIGAFGGIMTSPGATGTTDVVPAYTEVNGGPSMVFAVKPQ